MFERHKIVICLLVMALAIPSVGSGPTAMAQATTGTILSSPPAVPMPAVPAPSEASEPADPGQRPHLLKGVRLQPLARTMRLILMFDRPTAYAIRQDLQYQRVYLDLINTQVGFLSADLQRIEDSRLGGVWLKRVEPGLTTLELRLASPNVRIEHFSMDDPPAIVLDLERTDQDWATLPRIQAQTIQIQAPSEGVNPAPSTPAESTPPVPVPPVMTPPAAGERPRPVVPRDQLEFLGQQLVTQSSPTSESTETAETTPPPSSAEAGENPDALPKNTETPAGSQQLVDARHDGKEIKPLAAEYDYFPIDAINMTSPLGEEIMDDFLYRRWVSVLSKGLQYLELNPVNEESAYLLYLMAEARWQMTADKTKTAALGDLQNFYDQALRVFGRGDLAGFAHWRLAQIAMETHDLSGAVAHLNDAIQSSESDIQTRAQLMKGSPGVARRPPEAVDEDRRQTDVHLDGGPGIGHAG